MSGQRSATIRGRVLSLKKFQDFADECLGWAKTAKSDNERDVFLQMAQFWLEAAMLSEVGPTRVDRARHDVITRLAQTSLAQTASLRPSRISTADEMREEARAQSVWRVVNTQEPV